MSDMQLPPEPPQAPPPPPRSPFGDPSSAGPAFNREEAEKQVMVPAIGLMVTGVLAGLFAIYQMISPTDPDTIIAMYESMGVFESSGMDPEETRQMLGSFSAIAIVFQLLALAVSGLVFFGGLKMKGLQSYGLSMTACILSFIPCFTNCCCILGLVFGIWGIVALNKPEVKEAFS